MRVSCAGENLAGSNSLSDSGAARPIRDNPSSTMLSKSSIDSSSAVAP